MSYSTDATVDDEKDQRLDPSAGIAVPDPEVAPRQQCDLAINKRFQPNIFVVSHHPRIRKRVGSRLKLQTDNM